MTFKLLVEDQRGKLWVFKSAETQIDGAILQYRLYSLLGLRTPAIYPLRLQINDTVVEGSIQEFFPNIGSLRKFTYPDLGAKAQEEMALNHIMSWVSLNHHVHSGQFLVHKEKGFFSDYSISRIDNTVEWFLLGQDSLRLSFETPILWSVEQVGYAHFWRTYLKGLMSLKFENLLRFAALIESMPEDIFQSFFTDGIKRDFSKFSNNGDVPVAEFFKDVMDFAKKNNTKETFLSQLLQRKKQLSKDLIGFYQELAAIKGDSIKLKKMGYETLLQKQIKAMSKKKQELIAEIKSIPPVTQEQAKIVYDGSYEAHAILVQAYRYVFFQSHKESKQTLKRAQKKLEELVQKKQDLKEKIAIQNAIFDLRDSLDLLDRNPDISFMRNRMMGAGARLKGKRSEP